MSTGVIAREHEGTRVPPDAVIRYTFKERLVHWINSIAYTYDLLTGIALFTPHLYWLAAVLGGGPTIRFWHPWIGLVFMGTMFWMQSLWGRDMSTIDEDRRWIKTIKYYVRNEDEKVPPQGRFNAGQKQFYWIMFWGGVVLLITGIIMWFPEKIPPTLHWILPLTIFIHSATALITIAMFIIHVYMSVWMTPGSMKAMVRGYVSRQWARVHHRLWYEKIAGSRGPTYR